MAVLPTPQLAALSSYNLPPSKLKFNKFVQLSLIKIHILPQNISPLCKYQGPYTIFHRLRDSKFSLQHT